MPLDPDANRAFEDRVRHICRVRWPDARGGAALVDNIERDGFYETEDLVHIVEATVSTRKQYATDKAQKLSRLLRSLAPKYPRRLVRAWLVTSSDPTADQRSAVTTINPDINIVSFHEFTSTLVDAVTYLELRSAYSFGSARNLVNLSDHANVGDYVEMDILEVSDVASRPWTVEALLAVISSGGKRVVIVGDYGSGKSMTLREIFLRLKKKYLNNQTPRFPLYVNLRDHWGQEDPDEILERHARKIGYPHPPQLVRAWRAGFVTLILDGFDEVAAEGWGGKGRRLLSLRQKATKGVRRFVEETSSSAVVIAGRSHYFNNTDELRQALGTYADALYLTLNDFSEPQILAYLSKMSSYKCGGVIPDWLPSRPLLIGYLAQRGILNEILTNPETEHRAEGWRALLDMVCRREAAIDQGIYPKQLKRVLERVATLARARADGLGPLTAADMFHAFEEVVGQPPDDSARVILLRLPGLGPYIGDESGSRSFVDEDFADSARAGDMFELCKNTFSNDVKAIWAARVSLGRLGVSMVAAECKKSNVSNKAVSALIRHAVQKRRSGLVATDALRVLDEMGFPYDGSRVDISDAVIESIEIDSLTPCFSSVSFVGCLIDQVVINGDVSPSNMPRFVSCDIEAVIGRVSKADLPEGMLSDSCKVAAYSAFDKTTAAIMAMPIDEGTKILLSVLKKLFLQPGSGRIESSFYRGITPSSRQLVNEVLGLVEAEGLAKPMRLDRRIVWVPTRAEYGRVFRVLEAPTASRDPLVKKCKRIKQLVGKQRPATS